MIINDIDDEYFTSIREKIILYRLTWWFIFCLWYKSINIVLCLEGYCWTRTGERQAARMRARYLKAVLRQEVAYFDLHVTSTSEVITSVSNDSLVIQDVLSEKV
jgi:ATP-binding cassette subfamily B (MDR/TAP) protein 1